MHNPRTQTTMRWWPEGRWGKWRRNGNICNNVNNKNKEKKVIFLPLKWEKLTHRGLVKQTYFSSISEFYKIRKELYAGSRASGLLLDFFIWLIFCSIIPLLTSLSLPSTVQKMEAQVKYAHYHLLQSSDFTGRVPGMGNNRLKCPVQVSVEGEFGAEQHQLKNTKAGWSNRLLKFLLAPRGKKLLWRVKWEQKLKFWRHSWISKFEEEKNISPRQNLHEHCNQQLNLRGGERNYSW